MPSVQARFLDAATWAKLSPEVQAALNPLALAARAVPAASTTDRRRPGWPYTRQVIFAFNMI
jgi:hypothetical protein